MAENKTCEGCKYWELSGEAPDTEICRLNPPTGSQWPETAADDWCGQFEAKPQKAVVGTMDDFRT